MHWYKAKNILIMLFLIINIFLIYMLFATNHKNAKIPDSVIDNTLLLLNGKNIEADKKIIPEKDVTVACYEMKSAIMDKDEFSGMILGAVRGAKDGSVNISFGKNTFNIEAMPGYRPFGRINAKNHKKTIEEILNNLNFPKSNFIIKSEKQLNGRYEIVVCQEYGGIPLFGGELKIIFNEEGLINISGNWFYNITDRQQTNNTDIISTLLDFAVDTRAGGGRKIKNIYLTQYINSPNIDQEYQTISSISSIPAYCIETEGAGSFIFDARAGILPEARYLEKV